MEERLAKGLFVVFQVSGVWTSVDGLDLISTSEGRQLEHETGLYKISVWVLDLVSVPLSGFPVGKNLIPLVMKFKNSVPSALGFEASLQLFGHDFSLLQNFFDADSWILNSDGLLFRPE
ncbi:hypothetical protein RhiirA4_486022 [Rhizophagus irregularis]|uniref:Uncharacterized protein n=1 Tax=Rhizophagus irregularis TaxID=588596 RepID=A0A2I1HR53_9GLOM|nr:hypothetical protein RhiirA4_486022 [Rhizophagus irregularis]